jgi:hypothetical protein
MKLDDLRKKFSQVQADEDARQKVADEANAWIRAQQVDRMQPLTPLSPAMIHEILGADLAPKYSRKEDVELLVRKAFDLWKTTGLSVSYFHEMLVRELPVTIGSVVSEDFFSHQYIVELRAGEERFEMRFDRREVYL